MTWRAFRYLPPESVGDRLAQLAGNKFIKAKQLKRWAKLSASRNALLELRQVRRDAGTGIGDAANTAGIGLHYSTLLSVLPAETMTGARNGKLPPSTDPEREQPAHA
jgi:hypothetical protein